MQEYSHLRSVAFCDTFDRKDYATQMELRTIRPILTSRKSFHHNDFRVIKTIRPIIRMERLFWISTRRHNLYRQQDLWCGDLTSCCFDIQHNQISIVPRHLQQVLENPTCRRIGRIENSTCRRIQHGGDIIQVLEYQNTMIENPTCRIFSAPQSLTSSIV